MDGFIAKNNSQSPMQWTSKEDKQRFVELTKRAGVVILGGNTFKTFPKPLKDRVNIVYSRTLQPTEGVEITSDEPRLLLEKLEQRGFKEVAICGGAEVYTLFMKANLVDYIYLTVEPIIFGSGITLFNKDIDVRLVIESSRQSAGGTLFNDYKVLK